MRKIWINLCCLGEVQRATEVTCYEATLFEFACVDHFDPKKRDDSCKYWETGLNSSYFTLAILYKKKSAWNDCTGVCFGFVKIADSVMTQLILSNEYLCVIFALFWKKFLFKQNICMLFNRQTAHQLLSNYSQMTSCIEFINLSPEPIQNNFNITLRILQNMYLFIFMKNFDQVKWTKKTLMNMYDVDNYVFFVKS